MKYFKKLLFEYLKPITKMSLNAPKRINHETSTELLNKVDNFLFDCDGVIWNYPNPIEGAIECINTLKSLGKKCYFVTNNSTKTREDILTNLIRMGINDVKEEDIACTAWILASYLKSRDFKDKVYVIGSPAIGAELDAQGIKHTGIGPTDHIVEDPGNFNYKKNLELDPDVKCVTVGFDHYFNYPKLLTGATYVEKHDCEFICTNDDASLPTTNDSKAVIPGTGTMVNAMCTAITKEPVILGKPHKTMWEALFETHDLKADRTCMVGDRLDTDIAFADTNSLGASLAVLSGVTNEEQIQDFAHNDEKKHMCPEYYVSSLGEFYKYIKP